MVDDQYIGGYYWTPPLSPQEKLPIKKKKMEKLKKDSKMIIDLVEKKEVNRKRKFENVDKEEKQKRRKISYPPIMTKSSEVHMKINRKKSSNKENISSNKSGKSRKSETASPQSSSSVLKKSKNKSESKEGTHGKSAKKERSKSNVKEKRSSTKKQQKSNELTSAMLAQAVDNKIGPVAEEVKEYKHSYEDPDWLGNEDEAGSVASGIIEEDYCFQCGKSTMDCLGNNSVVLCDVCDGEYHLSCAGLTKLPRSTFVCHKCVEEQENQKNLRFNVCDAFRIPKRNITDRIVVYSPSRPLETAWEECKQKGLMTVSNVFDYETMRYKQDFPICDCL